MIETSELGGRLALVDPKSLETEQRSLYDFIGQKFVRGPGRRILLSRLMAGATWGLSTLSSTRQK